jgi:hypothetical protein
LSECSPARQDAAAPLYPAVEQAREISRRVAEAVGAAAQREGVAEATSGEVLERRAAASMWQPRYVPYIPARRATARRQQRATAAPPAGTSARAVTPAG